MKKDTKRLPDSELEVMQVIWSQNPPVARKTVEEEMKKIHPIAQTTLLTLITRLSDKGYISIEKRGRNSEYTPLIKQEEYQAKQSKQFFDKMFGGNVGAFASALCDSGISKEDLQELKELLDRNEL